MAVGIMSPWRPASLQCLYLLACFLQVLIQGRVFEAPQNQAVFLRSKRANLFLVEEILQGDLERECYEELCSFEEAREYFEDTDKTISFWTVYYDGDQCDPNPCLHGGNCTDKVGGFHCSCPAPHYGPACELGATRDGGPPTSPQITADDAECPIGGPTACHQLCTASYRSFTCSCMVGFKLQSDGRSCVPEVAFPCGRLPNKLNTTVASMCRQGNCPWQVSLLNSGGEVLCGGVVLGRHSVLTTARCLVLVSGSDLRPSNFAVLAGGDGKEKLLVPVQGIFIHNRFHTDHHDDDLALLELARPLPFGPALIHLCLPDKDFSENILMHSGRTGIATRLGEGQTQKLVYMTLDECRHHVNVSHPLSNKMFCMRRQNGANRTQKSPYGPLGKQNGTQRNLNGHTVNQNQNPTQNGTPNGVNQDQMSSNGPLRNQNGTQGSLNGLFGEKNGTQGSPNRPLRNQNGTNGNPNGSLKNHNRVQGVLNGHTVNQNPNGMPNGVESYTRSHIRNLETSKSDQRSASKVTTWRCGGLLPGTAVTTVERGTAFLTGLLMSCDNAGGGTLVFTKLSRYLSWIRPRLEAAEDHMTPQVSQYPEIR